MTHYEQLVAYLERMTEIEPLLSAVERKSLNDWYRSPEFTRDSDWPGWQKHLGPRPVKQPLRVLTMKRNSA